MPKVFSWTKKLPGRSSGKSSGQATVTENPDPESTSSCIGQSKEKKKKYENGSKSGNLSNSSSHSSDQPVQESDVKDKPSAFDKRPNFIKRLSPEKYARNPEAKSSAESGPSPEKKKSVEKRHNSDRRPSPEKRLSGEKITSTFARKFASFRLGSDRKNSDRDSRSKSKSPELEQTNEKDQSRNDEIVTSCPESPVNQPGTEKSSTEQSGGAVNGTAATSNASGEENGTANGLHTTNGSVEDHSESNESSSLESTEIRSSPRMSRGPGRQSISEKLYGEVIKEFDKIRSTKTSVNRNVSNLDPSELENERTHVEQGHSDSKCENEYGAKKCLNNNNVINSRFTVSAVKEVSIEKPVLSNSNRSDMSLVWEKDAEDAKKSQKSVPENHLETPELSTNTEVNDTNSKNNGEVIPKSPESDMPKETIQHPLPQAPLAEDECSLDNEDNDENVDIHPHSGEKEESLNNSDTDSTPVNQVPEIHISEETTVSDNTAKELANEKKEDIKSSDQNLNIEPDVNVENGAQHVIQSSTASVSESNNEEAGGSCTTQEVSSKDDSRDIPVFSDNQCHSPGNASEIILTTPSIHVTDDDSGSDEPLTLCSGDLAVREAEDLEDRPLIISECTDVIPLELSEPLCSPVISMPEKSHVEEDKVVSFSSSNQSQDISDKVLEHHYDVSEVSTEISETSELQSDEDSKSRHQSMPRETDKSISIKEECHSSSENLPEEQNNHLVHNKERFEVHSVCQYPDDDEVAKSSSPSPPENDAEKSDGAVTTVQSEDATNDPAISLKKEMLALLDETFDGHKTSDIDDTGGIKTVKVADETEESPMKQNVTSSETHEEKRDLPNSSECCLDNNNAEKKPVVPVARRRLHYEDDNEATGELHLQHDPLHMQGIAQTNGDHPDESLEENDKKSDSKSLMSESYEESSLEGGSGSLSASPTAPRRRKKSQPVPAARSIYSDKCKEDLLPLTNGEGTGKKEQRSSSFSSPPPPRPPAPSVSCSLIPVRERSSTVPSKTYDGSPRANASTKEQHSSKSVTSEKVNIPIPAVRTKVSLNPFDSDEDDEPEPSSEERQSQKQEKPSLNPFDSDYDDDNDNIRESTNVQSMKKEQSPAGYNPFDEDDEEVSKPLASSDSFPRTSPIRVPPSRTNLNDSLMSASSQSSRTTNEASTNPFDEDEDEDCVSSCDNSTLSRESRFRQSLATTSSSPFQRERIRASLPSSTGKVYLSKKKRQAPLPPGSKFSGTMSACNTPVPPRSETALLRGESYSSLDRSFLRKNTATSYSTLSLATPKKAPPPRPPPPKVRSVSLAQLK